MATCPLGTFAYTIKAGDNYYRLAMQYNTTVAAIMAANPGVDPNALMIGQVICIPLTAPITCPPGSFAYTIKAGDNYYRLAQKYNTTVAAIMAANPGVNPNALMIGQVICIPLTTPVTCPPGTFAYTIKAGDNYYRLAQQYNTTVQAIMAANPGVDPNALMIGQVICIPFTPPIPCPPGVICYTIVAGDTYYKLAQQYNTTVEAITALNPGVDPNNLYIGQVIYIPGTP